MYDAQLLETFMRSLGSLEWYRGTRGIQKGHWWLCAGPVLLRGLDYGVTLYGQPAAYWEGNFARPNEGSLILHWCLQQHPLLFVAVALVLTGFSSLLILCWPRKPAEILAGLMMLGHAFGIATWVNSSPVWGLAACLALVYCCLSIGEAMEENPLSLGRRHSQLATSG